MVALQRDLDYAMLLLLIPPFAVLDHALSWVELSPGVLVERGGYVVREHVVTPDRCMVVRRCSVRLVAPQQRTHRLALPPGLLPLTERERAQAAELQRWWVQQGGATGPGVRALPSVRTSEAQMLSQATTGQRETNDRLDARGHVTRRRVPGPLRRSLAVG